MTVQEKAKGTDAVSVKKEPPKEQVEAEVKVKNNTSKDKTAKRTIRIKFDFDQCEVDEFIEMQGGDIKTLRNVLGRMILGPNGNYLPPDAGAKLIGKLTLTELRGLSDQVTMQIESPKG